MKPSKQVKKGTELAVRILSQELTFVPVFLLGEVE